MTQPPNYRPPVVAGYPTQPPQGDWSPPAPKSRAVPVLIGVVVVLVLAVAGLAVVLLQRSSERKPAASSVAAPTTAAAATPTKAAAEEYGSAQRLAGDLNTAGIACLKFEQIPDATGALDRGSCYVLAEEVGVGIYASHEEAAGTPAYLAALMEGVSDVDVVVGGNWSLNCDSADLCKRIEHDFGGTYVHIPK